MEKMEVSQPIQTRTTQTEWVSFAHDQPVDNGVSIHTQPVTGGVLSDKTIVSCRDSGQIFIEPFRKDNLSSCSYDVCLGPYFYRMDGLQKGDIFNPSSARSIDTKYRLRKAMTLGRMKEMCSDVLGKQSHDQVPIHQLEYAEDGKVSKDSGYIMPVQLRNGSPDDTMYGIKDDEEVIFLRPKESILGHTLEFIGGVDNITTKMQARSSFGRCGVEVCRDAGWGDVSYFNRWTMELENTTNEIIPLVVGGRCAQICFFRTDETGISYAKTGQYQVTDKVKELVESWKPTMMLPKPWKRDFPTVRLVESKAISLC